MSCAKTTCNCLCDQCLRARQRKPRSRHCKIHTNDCHLNCGK